MELTDPMMLVLAALLVFFFFIYLMLRRTLVGFREGYEGGRE